MAIDLYPLAIGDQVAWASRRPVGRPPARHSQRAPGDAALAVGPGDQRATKGKLRITQGSEQGTRTTEPEADAEATARREPGQRLVIVGGRRRGGHSRVSSSS